MVSADTNVLLRWALGDLPEQSQRAAALLEGDTEVQIADSALIEMSYVLEKVYGLDRALVSNYLRAVMTLGQVNCNRSLFSEVLPLYEQHKQLSLIDCCLAVYAKLNDTEPLYTFDKKLVNQLEPAALLT